MLTIETHARFLLLFHSSEFSLVRESSGSFSADDIQRTQKDIPTQRMSINKNIQGTSEIRCWSCSGTPLHTKLTLLAGLARGAVKNCLADFSGLEPPVPGTDEELRKGPGINPPGPCILPVCCKSCESSFWPGWLLLWKRICAREV